MFYPYYMNARIEQIEKDRRSKEFGEPIRNPFRVLRVNARMSLQGLAIASRISKTAVQRAELGAYVNPLPSLMEYWQRASPNSFDEFEVLNDYETFRYQTRMFNRYFFGEGLLEDFISLESLEHPLRQLRKNRRSLWEVDPGGERYYLPVGITETSRALCVPLDTLQFFERKTTQKSVPAELINALHLIGYDDGSIEFFQHAHQVWRESKKAGITVT